METTVFNRLREIVHQSCGIALTEDKKALVESRVAKRLRALGLSSERRYLEIIELDATGEELQSLIDVMSTNVTYFYREPAHFVQFEEFLRVRSEQQKEIKVWCAASSTGEEPYTLAMIAREVFGAEAARVRILATDISTKVLKLAVAKQYQTKQLRDLPPQLRTRYLTSPGRQATVVTVIPEVARLVTFRQLNLAKFPLPLSGPIDVVFCRNVMIYFDLELRQKIVAEFERLLAPQGRLFVGHSENLLGIRHSLKAAHTGAYYKE